MTTIAPPTADQLLDLDGVSRRNDTVRFDLLNQALAKIGELAVDRSHTPEVVNDVNRPIRRTLDQFRLLPRTMNDTYSPLIYAGEVNVISQRVRPVWVLGDGDGSTDYEFPLGVFLWGDNRRGHYSWGVDQECSLVDQSLILDQKFAENIGYPAGTNLSTALTAQAAAVGIASTSIEATSRTLQAPAAWPAGRDTRLSVMEKLCATAGFLAPYFDNNGMLVCRSAPNLATATATLAYAPGTRMVAASIFDWDDLLSAPNRYLAIDTSATAAAIVGIFDVPAAAPHSFANRGFYVVAVVEIQGLADAAAANAAAAAAYAQDSSTFAWLAFDSTPDPRHDTFDVVAVQLDGGGATANYREQGWRLPLAATAHMSHDLRGIYS